MIIMKHEFKVSLEAAAVRHYCIQLGLFTCGDNEQYGEMLNKCGIITADDLYAIAEDIYQYSDWETLKENYGERIPEEVDCIDQQYIDAIVFDIIRYCKVFAVGKWVSDYEDYEPSDLETGFDPYEGCYTYDC